MLAHLGVVAAAEQGIYLDRFPLVPAIPPARWVEVVAMLADSLQIILAAPPATLGASPARRLAARVRERRAVLITLGDRWPGPVDVRLHCQDLPLGGPGSWLRPLAGPPGRGQKHRPRRSHASWPGAAVVTGPAWPADSVAANDLAGAR